MNKAGNTRNLVYILSQMNKEIEKFVNDIVKDTGENMGNIFLKLFINKNQMLYEISLYNSFTKSIVTKQYPLIEFVQKGIDKQIEFELNYTIREMLLKSKDKVYKIDQTIYI